MGRCLAPKECGASAAATISVARTPPCRSREAQNLLLLFRSCAPLRRALPVRCTDTTFVFRAKGARFYADRFVLNIDKLLTLRATPSASGNNVPSAVYRLFPKHSHA
jgi:hypothetical protein